MPNLNKVMLMGHMTRDAELRYTPGNTAVADFGLAINRRWKDAAGNQKDETTFVDLTAWGKSAEAIAKHLQKGSPLFVEGRLTYQTWDDKKTGAKRSKVLVTVENFQFIDSKPKGESAPSASGAPEARRASPAPAGGAKPAAEEYDYTQDVEDDTIPF